MMFGDPEAGSVTYSSSRGPCYTNSGNGIEDRLKPVTTAAAGLATSTCADTSYSQPPPNNDMVRMTLGE